jgi:predicted PurR-regulated permease PerM
LHPVALIFALFVFSYLFGFVGVLVAVPVSAAIGVLIRFGLELYLKSPIYRGAKAEPVTKPPESK